MDIDTGPILDEIARLSELKDHPALQKKWGELFTIITELRKVLDFRSYDTVGYREALHQLTAFAADVSVIYLRATFNYEDGQEG